MVNQPYKLIDPIANLSEEQVAKSVKYLRKAFMTAWWEYRETHVNVVIGFRRDKGTKQPITSPNADMTVYDAQIEFAYLINEIERGYIFDVPNPIRKCNELIDSLSV